MIKKIIRKIIVISRLYKPLEKVIFLLKEIKNVTDVYWKNKFLRLSYDNYRLHSDFFQSIEGEDLLFIDVGALNGWYARIVYHFLPQARVISFEPLRSQIEPLNKLKKEHPGYIFHSVAVGASEGEQKITEFGTPGLSSLKDLSRTDIYHKSFDTSIKNQYPVKVVSLDNFFSDCKDPLVVKIDTQGSEWGVLQGMKRLISSGQVRYIIIELVNIEKYIGEKLAPDIFRFLFDQGYIIHGLKSSHKIKGQLTEFDAIFKYIK